MLLEDATSKEQVQAALDAGDEELREDIEEKLSLSRRWWDNKGMYSVGEGDDLPDLRDFVEDPEFVDAVIVQSPPEYDLSILPVEVVEKDLRWTSRQAKRIGNSQRWLRGPFYIDTQGGDFFSWGGTRTLEAYFPDRHLPMNSDFIPEGMAEEFWDSLEGGVSWDNTETVNENQGHLVVRDVFVEADEDDFKEWCRDLLAGQLSKLVESQPEVVKEAFLSKLKLLEDNGEPLVKRLLAAQVPEHDLLSLAVAYLGGMDDERDEVIGTIEEYLGGLTEGADEPREVIGEWSRDDLRAMGITKGPLYEEAPWKLIKLHPADLRLEGALMRHCVGDKAMGYIKALKDGEVELWSLRSRNGKPRFTLEVDADLYDADQNSAPRSSPAALRGRAIKQLKGKANRTPGYADKYATEITFPDEVLFWGHAFDELDVDADQVEDFSAFARPLRRNGEVCTGFDLPYRPLRRR